MSRSLESIKITRLGEKLKKLRQIRGMSMRQVAHALEITAYSYLSEIENNKKMPSFEMLLALALLYETTTDELLFDEKELKQPLPEK